MRYVEPSVTLEAPFNEDDALRRIEAAGRTCWKSENKITQDSAKRFVKALIKNRHDSVLEHVSVSFRIICDRGTSHEIVRSRLASYSMESTRYCLYNDFAVIEPPGLDGDANESASSDWAEAMFAAERAYFSLINRGYKPEIARSVLPMCLKTELVMTANIREWRHFLKLRLSKRAHPQIRQIAAEIKKQLGFFAEDINDE